jgi:hypothetical protein
MSFLLLYITQFFSFFFLLLRKKNQLICPRLPLRISDTEDVFSFLKGLAQIQNLKARIFLDLQWQDFRRMKLKISWSGQPYSLSRGVYDLLAYRLEITDWAGFFSYQIHGDFPAQLTVFPGVEKGGPLSLETSRRFSEQDTVFSSLKNQDFFEARPYYPGDDPRRIHWKMLARHEELFIREGSRLKPFKESCLIVAEPALVRQKKWFRSMESFDRGDSVLRSLSGVMESLLEKDLRVSGFFSGDREISDLGKLNKDERQDLLASLPPVPLGTTPKIPDVGILLCFFSSPPNSDFMLSLENQYPQAVKFLFLPFLNREERREGWTFVEA